MLGVHVEVRVEVRVEVEFRIERALLSILGRKHRPSDIPLTVVKQRLLAPFYQRVLAQADKTLHFVK